MSAVSADTRPSLWILSSPAVPLIRYVMLPSASRLSFFWTLHTPLIYTHTNSYTHLDNHAHTHTHTNHQQALIQTRSHGLGQLHCWIMINDFNTCYSSSYLPTSAHNHFVIYPTIPSLLLLILYLWTLLFVFSFTGIGAESIVFASALSQRASLFKKTSFLMRNHPTHFNDVIRKCFLGNSSNSICHLAPHLRNWILLHFIILLFSPLPHRFFS